MTSPLICVSILLTNEGIKIKIQIPAGTLIQQIGKVEQLRETVFVVPTLVQGDGKFQRVYFRLGGSEFSFIREGK